MLNQSSASRLVREILEGALSRNRDRSTSLENLRDDSHLIDEMGLTSLDMVEFFLGIEDQFGIQIPDEDEFLLTSVSAVIQFLDRQGITVEDYTLLFTDDRPNLNTKP